jgi:membrane associated rhomboid family serine protease
MKKPFSNGLNSVIDRILILLISCFVAQLLFELVSGSPHGRGIHFQLFGFSSHFLTNGYLWSIASYVFLHEGPFLLIMNLIGIHFICRAVERDLGTRNFYWLCSLAAIFACLFWLAFNFSGTKPLSGFSTIVMASITFFCFSHPERPITLLLFFVLPISIKPKFLLLGLLGLELFGFVFWELRDNQTINCSAHLGGMLTGAFVFRYLHSGKEFPQFVFSSTRGKKTKVKPKLFGRKRSSAKASYAVDFSDQQSMQEEVDRILDKINENGFGALTQEEKNILEKAKGLLNRG